jgi:nucleotide-binding universal stress UspA family protein
MRISMSYKTLLVQIDQSAQSIERMNLAAALADAERAHLIGTAMTGISRVVFEAGVFKHHDPAFDHHVQVLRQYADKSLELFESAMERQPGLSSESRLLDDDAVGGISLQARYVDLVLIGQFDSSAGVPVLIFPSIYRFSALPTHAIIAWDGSMTAARAITGSLPLLKRAGKVGLVVFNPGERPDTHGEQPGADMALYLSRQGVSVEVMVRETTTEAGDALLSLCADEGADLLVMGAYGHSRFRELLLGGATRQILDSMIVPVLMAH